MEATLEQALKLGLTEDEFEHIKQILGRTPNFNETAVYSVMWSEHCSYKNSIQYLKKLPREGSRLLVKAGEENAGLVDIGNGQAVVFKIESHNHPSAIEPFQGAATGVGGIHRDIFTMGARPVAALNSLRFGNLKSDKTKHLLKGIVKGIGHYGNCFGVPTVGGEVYFEDCYQTNPLVNAMSVGIVQVGHTFSATSYGVGNPVFIVGAATGKDGIGGASFASADITEESAAQLPAVQVGDPFEEKKLLEACMELVGKDLIIGMQDMGAAGISCSTSEMSAKGEHGMDIDLSKVPTRQDNMHSWEMLLSESQERMLIVVKKGHEESVRNIFEKWDIHCEQIGVVTDSPLLNYYLNGELQASIPAESLVLGGGAPVYSREYTRPGYLDDCVSVDLSNIALPNDLQSVAMQLIKEPNIASKKYIYEQYDSMVGAANVSTNRPSDAAIVKIHNTSRALAITVDCNSRYVYLNPYIGGMIAVSEAARNIACSGGLPLGVTNCLNFGNPYNPEVYYQFVYALKGMSEACIKFDTPVTGGNVSFYNQSEDGPVYPTPTIGMVGILDDLENDLMTLDFKNQGDSIYLLGHNPECINGSEYLFKICGLTKSSAPHFDLNEEYLVQKAVLDLIKKKQINAAHDLSEGGLIVALLECAMPKRLGFTINPEINIRKDVFLFGESQGRILVSVPAEKVAGFEAANLGVPILKIGEVTSGNINVWNEEWADINTWQEAYNTAIELELNA